MSTAMTLGFIIGNGLAAGGLTLGIVLTAKLAIHADRIAHAAHERLTIHLDHNHNECKKTVAEVYEEQEKTS